MVHSPGAIILGRETRHDLRDSVNRHHHRRRRPLFVVGVAFSFLLSFLLRRAFRFVFFFGWVHL